MRQITRTCGEKASASLSELPMRQITLTKGKKYIVIISELPMRQITSVQTELSDVCDF